jgi:cell wall-associated NlpC family hydrolase
MAPVSYYTDTSRLVRPYLMGRPQEYYNAIPRLAQQYGPGQQLEEDPNDPVRRQLRQDGNRVIQNNQVNTYGTELANRLSNASTATTRNVQSILPSQSAAIQASPQGFANPYLKQLSQIGEIGRQATERVIAAHAKHSNSNDIRSLDLSGIEGARAKAIAAAKSQLGVQYGWGGESPGKQFDCSGLVQYAYRKAGINLPRVSQEQMRRGKITSISSLKPGDLVGWGHPAHHIAIYLGNGRIIEAPHTGSHVRIISLSQKGGGAWGIHLNI